MDLLKALTGKNAADYEYAARILVEKPDIELYKKLVAQEDFLFDFVKNNVSKRISNAITKDNYKNLLELTKYYSPSYDTVFAQNLYEYSGKDILPIIENLLKTGNNAQKTYATKTLSLLSDDIINKFLTDLRNNAKSEFEPLSTNSIEVLAKINDKQIKEEAIKKLDSYDEFEQFEGIKILVTFGAKDTIHKIFNIMKKSSLSENIAAEIPFLVPIEDLLEKNFDGTMLILCNIINAIPEIVPLSTISDYDLPNLLKRLFYNNLTSSSALLLKLSKEKFNDIAENDEYLFDCDKNTKDEIYAINKFLSDIDNKKLDSLLYEELYDESDFVFYAVDLVNNIDELETLLDSKNQTLILKVLTKLKNNNMLSHKHKQIALTNITNNEIRQIVQVL